MKLFQYLLNNYGYNEPIFNDELQEDLTVKNSTLRMNLKRLVDTEEIKRYAPGIYYIPKPNSLLKNQTLSFNKVLKKKYLYEGMNPIGYQTGIALANRLNLTSQTAGVIEIVTNKETNRKRIAKINNWELILRKPRIPIKKKNIKVLQALDLLTNYENLSEKKLKEGSEIVINYLDDVNLDKKELDSIINSYPMPTIIKAYESGVYDALTRG
ncbi:hypothetical protein [Lentibacillus sp. CBA3610]|uniref:hypothetical protein n=1 Tax=Lentibacillus sp. CBA3610 TaxID=2518176 RepID=UPI001595A034|nr:hypothetical protein [Lentibacillus sp. CBA3610]QKY70106.1 hypothetical protein Len3610_11355 [Lentibacillus sp. CBA3610]